jgi:excisionase family DNA binding protein
VRGVWPAVRVAQPEAGSLSGLSGGASAAAMSGERLLTAAELAEMLGFSAATVVDWAEAGKVPAFKLGGRLRFRWSEVSEWLESQRFGSDPCQRPEMVR